MLPVLTEYMNDFQPQSASECEVGRFHNVLRLAADIDRFEFRLRGTTEGRATINAIERAVERKEKTGIEVRKEDRIFFLDQIKGTNEVDRAIQDNYWIDKKVKISDSELLEFSNYLVERDPTYPTWSETDFIKDYSRVNEAENPSQVYIFKKPERFYEAYAEFNRKINRTN